MDTTTIETRTPPVGPEIAAESKQNEVEERLQLVTFELGDEEFGIGILPVQEIVRMMTITRVPQSPPSVEGVVNLRGQITPVLDLRKRFELEAQAQGNDSRIVVVEIHDRVLGFIVDRVNEVLEVPASTVESAPTLVTSVDSDYVRGVVKLEERLLILLDLERLFGVSEIDRLERAVEAAA